MTTVMTKLPISCETMTLKFLVFLKGETSIILGQNHFRVAKDTLS